MTRKLYIVYNLCSIHINICDLIYFFFYILILFNVDHLSTCLSLNAYLESLFNTLILTCYVKARRMLAGAYLIDVAIFLEVNKLSGRDVALFWKKTN